MRYLLLVLIVVALPGCMLVDDVLFGDAPNACQAPPPVVAATVEPPRLAPASVPTVSPVQTSEPPR
jgi:hypothetical protein